MQILFLCVENSARSQMAEGLARHHAPESVMVWSAGSRPSRVRPQAIAVLKECGIDIKSHTSKGLDEVPVHDMNLIVTLCAEEFCPVVPGAHSLHWPIDDPARGEASNEEDTLQQFRTARDTIENHILKLYRQVAVG